jgi:hypothetical protein
LREGNRLRESENAALRIFESKEGEVTERPEKIT